MSNPIIFYKKIINLALGSLIAFLFMVFSADIVLAGGGGVYAGISNTDDPHWDTVHVYFDPKIFTCKGMVVTFNFANPEDGDVISGLDGHNSSTITNDASYETINGQQYLRCSTYAKVYSVQLELNRLLNISFKGDNSEGSRTIAISFGINYNWDSQQLLPWETYSSPSPTPEPSASPTPSPSYFRDPLPVFILGQIPFDGSKGKMRHVVIKWIGPIGDFKYTVYERPDADAPLHTAGWATTGELLAGPSTTLDLAADHDWYIKVETCNDGKCIHTIKSAFLPKVPVLEATKNSSSGENKVDEPAKKVNDLQNQLDQSRALQNVLEQRVNYLVSLIKHLFPIFK